MRKVIIIISCLLTLLFCGIHCNAQTESTMEQCTIKTSQLDVFRYWLYTPENPTEDMPLIVYLHGGSGKGSDLTAITAVDGFPKYLQDGQLGNLRAYVIIPQLPSDQKGWNSVSASIMQLINKTIGTYSIEKNNISLTGHSMGGTGAWAVAAAYPGTFARVAPLSGSIKNTTININKLNNMPVWAMVGSADTIVDPVSSEEFVSALQQAGGNAKLTVFEGATHFDVPELAYLNDPALLNWLIDAKFAVCDATDTLYVSAEIEDAIGQGDYIRLLQDAQADIQLEQDLYIDLNGHELTGTISGSGTLYGMDSSSDSYTLPAGRISGSISCKVEHVKTNVTGTSKRYLAIADESGYTFHRYYVGITKVSLRPGSSGFGYKARFCGDAAVQELVQDFGFRMNLKGSEKLLFNTLPGSELDSDREYSVLLRNFDVENYGQHEVEAQAFIHLVDGTELTSNTVSYSMKTMLQTIHEHVEDFAQQLESIRAMCAGYESVMKDWNIDQFI